MTPQDEMTALGQANSLVWKARLEAYRANIEAVHLYLCKVNGHIEAQMTEVMQRVIGTKDEDATTQALYETSAEAPQPEESRQAKFERAGLTEANLLGC